MQFDILITIVIAILAFIATMVGSYYSRNSFLLDLKVLEKDKKRTEKAKHYFDTYINRAPSFRASPYQKQIDSDDLNESVKLPYAFTDFLIKNFPDRYFYFITLLNKSWSHFEISDFEENQKIICKIKSTTQQKWKYFLLYISFAMCTSILILYNDIIINKITMGSELGTFIILCFFIIISMILTCHSLYKATQISEIEMLIKEFEKKAPE